MVLSSLDQERREFMFPGYLFVKLKADWELLIRQRGIRRFFFTDERPWQMPTADIEALRGREDERGFVRLRPRIAVGQSVKVGEGGGVFAGFTGVYQGADSRQRCRVLFALLGHETIAELDERLVAAA